MGFLDKAKDFAGKNPDKVTSAIDKAGDMFDAKTGGKHAKHTDKVQGKANEFLTGGSHDAGANDTPSADTPADEGQPPA